MIRMKRHFPFLHFFGALLALVLFLSACNVPANAPTQVPVEVPTEPVATEAPTQAPTEESGGFTVSIDVSGVAQDFTSQVVEVVDPGSDGPWWGVMPQYTQLTLQGYPTPDHLLKPQIFVFPVDGLSINETANGNVLSLQTLLQTQQIGDSLPYLPLYNAAQVMHAKVEYLDFKNGHGVRYLTQFDQAILPINNHELHYTFQGLTGDGKYYVAAVLPVNLPELPADESVDLNNPPQDFVEDFPTYLSDTVNMIGGQPAGAFTPDLGALDAMIASLEIK
ncbi:MAG: hypothetical protein PVJ21_14990 [Anaerolineales bacterium]|jgi:hypothetical protein